MAVAEEVTLPSDNTVPEAAVIATLPFVTVTLSVPPVLISI